MNLYAERNEPDAPYPFSYYPTAGTVQKIAPTGTGHRCAYTATNGQLFEVVGSTVYATSSAMVRTALGTIGNASTPASISDNGLCAVVVDGSANGWVIDLTTHAFAAIVDVNGAFYGSDFADCVDGYFVFNQPATANLYISLANVSYANLTGTVDPGQIYAAFDPTYIAQKPGADPLQRAIVFHREIWLIGTQRSCVFYDAGTPDFPFGIIPGVFIEHGACAKYSIATSDLQVFWLHQDRQGQGIVMMGDGYAAKRISTHAIEQSIRSYAVISDAIGFIYQQLGHTFYVLTFPTADATWVFDQAEQLWHELTWTDTNGAEHRHRGNDAANAYGLNLTGDWQTGALYCLDPTVTTDNGQPIVRRRGFPLLRDDARRIEYSRLVLDMDVGESAATTSVDRFWGLSAGPGLALAGSPSQPLAAAAIYGSEPLVSLRCSDDRGKTWGNPVTQSLGATGEFGTSILFTQLGIGRNRVFEVFWDAPVQTAINGADVFLELCET